MNRTEAQEKIFGALVGCGVVLPERSRKAGLGVSQQSALVERRGRIFGGCSRPFRVTAFAKGDAMSNIVLEKEPELEIRSGYEAELVVEPADISFQDVAGGLVRIRVNIRNEGGHCSSPTVLRLESAPLGAFVPWRPLAVLPVPAIEPGESRAVSYEAVRPRPASLGGFDRIPPARLLTAVNAPDESRQPGARLAATLDLLRRQTTARLANRSVVNQGPSLSPDFWDLLGRGQPHWAGNLNVFVGARAVERHQARALRVYSGRPNLAMFAVGEAGRSDAYAFDLVGLTPDWKAALHDVTHARTLLVGASDTPIRETQWVEADGGLMIMLAVRPPAGCEEGNLEVRVTRRSCQKTAVVEFDLDPESQGAGCYVV